jgi:hypothetical protein
MTHQPTEGSELDEYDSLDDNPIKNIGLAGEIESILRGYETVADGEGNPRGFDLAKDDRTEDGFYWEFDDIAEAAQKIVAHTAQRLLDTEDKTGNIVIVRRSYLEGLAQLQQPKQEKM